MTRRRKKAGGPDAGEATDAAVESDDIDLFAILRFIGIIIAMIVLSMLAMKLLFDRLLAEERAHDPRPSPLAELAEPRLPPAPRLQTAPEAELGRMRAEEERRLRTYGWVDPAQNRVRIPIDRAMDLMAERDRLRSASPPELPGGAGEARPSDSVGKRGRHAQ